MPISILHVFVCFSRGPYCVATDQFIAQASDDLSFQAGDVIELLERIDDSWLKGYMNGQVGIFPQVFVRIERDLPSSSTPNLLSGSV